jgi:hypothetical protein
MLELDKALEPIAELMNLCYENAFPSYPKFPKFSFTRATATLWKNVVYEKLKANLNDALSELLKIEKNKILEKGKTLTELEQ